MRTMIEHPPGGSLRSNLRWGIRWALWIATGLSAWVLALALGKHSWRFRADDLEMSVSQVIAAYYAAGLIAGTGAGLLRPLTRWRIGTFVMGAIVSTLVYATVGFTMYGWSSALWIAPILGLSTGGLALVIQDEDRGETSANPRRLLGLALVAIVLLLVLWRLYWAP